MDEDLLEAVDLWAGEKVLEGSKTVAGQRGSGVMFDDWSRRQADRRRRTDHRHGH